MRDKEGGLNVAAVGVLALAIEHVFVEVNVVVVDGIVEGDHDHLRHLLSLQFARDFRARFRAEAVGQQTDGRVTRRSPIRIGGQI